jgi:lycopene beta-cyclase
MRPVIILGGGLWGGLLALRLKLDRPDVTFVLHEAQDKLGGNHTWSFHETDVAPENMKWLSSIIRTSWNGYDVKFPEYTKHITVPYHSISSEKFNHVIQKILSKEELQLNSTLSLTQAKELSSIIIDTRGILPETSCGWQKFVGLEVELLEPHGFKFPILMDATIAQKDGFRFIYYLPMDEKTILVEDTRYSEAMDLDVAEIEHEIEKIIFMQGWRRKEILRREVGILPLPLKKVHSVTTAEVINLGGIFHDTTGYSFPDAVRVTDALLKTNFSYQALNEAIKTYGQSRVSDRFYFRLLNHLMFKATSDDLRYKVLQHFYRMPQPFIEKFYRGQMTAVDRLRMFMGRPPVPVSRALKTFINVSFEEFGS